MPPAERVKRRLSDQGALHVQGAGILLDGYYAELQPSCISAKDTPQVRAYRRLRPNGDWAYFFLVQHASLHRWCFTETLWLLQSPTAWSAASSSNGHFLKPWEIGVWHQDENRAAELTVSRCALPDLPKDARKQAKAVFKKTVKYNSFRTAVSGCPSACNNPEARDWGLAMSDRTRLIMLQAVSVCPDGPGGAEALAGAFVVAAHFDMYD